MTEGHKDYLGDLWDLLPTDPTDFLENPPIEDEAEKAPTSEWAFDHDADVSAHHARYTDGEAEAQADAKIAIHAALPTVHQDAPGLIETHRLVAGAHHSKYTDANARGAISNIFGADGKADSDIDIDSHALENVTNLPNKTTANWSKTIGATGDYLTWAAMMPAMPNLLAHDVTITIQTGTTLTEQCFLQNKHSLVAGKNITVQAARYYPTIGFLPTADGAGAAYLEDASVFTVDDYYNDCWILVVHGTGTDNGFVKITDTDQATGRATVASWPGTEPDNTSRYVIVGALIDGGGIISYLINFSSCTVSIYLKGIGIKDSNGIGVSLTYDTYIEMTYCGVFGCDTAGIVGTRSLYIEAESCGIVGNNTDNSVWYGGIYLSGVTYGYVNSCGISDNNRRGVLASYGGFVYTYNTFGDLNGDWGTFANYSAQVWCDGSQCSGTSGDHSNGVGDGSLVY